MPSMEELQRGPPNSNLRSRLKSSESEARILANRYEVIKKLGCGSHGTVYLVSDILYSKELYVVKEIYIGDVQPDETVGAVNEARLLCKLCHPGIVKFHNSFIDGDFFCIVTEYCEGGDLDVMLRSCRTAGKELDNQLLLNWFVQLLHAIHYMHQRNVLHRDLKSKNIFLKNNTIKIGDFGISRILLGSLDKATTFTGTPYYMAPEVLSQDGYNSKSDIWSLGVILYQMCCLKQPFPGKNLPEVIFNITQGDIPSLPPHYGKDLEDIYWRMLRRDPIKRVSAIDILNNQFIINQIETLKISTDSNEYDVKFQTDEIVQILRLPKKKNTVDKSNIPPIVQHEPLTARDQLRYRKLLRGDLEAEKLKQITASLYEESRQKYSSLKKRQSIVAVPFLNNENEDEDEDEVSDIKSRISIANDEKNDLLDVEDNNSKNDLLEVEVDKTIISTNVVTKDVFNGDKTQCNGDKTQYTHCFGESSDGTVLNIPQKSIRNRISIDDAMNDLLESENKKCIISNNVITTDVFNGDKIQYNGHKTQFTHCSEESIDDAMLNRPQKRLQYTHCFGENDDTGNGDSLEEVFIDKLSEVSECSQNLTLSTNIPDDVSTTIPDDASVADTFYSTFNDFEDDSGNSDTCELDAVAECLQNALDVGEENGYSTLSEYSFGDIEREIRQQKITSLRNECIKLLGTDGFSRVYKFLDKVRFQSQSCMSESAIMKKLRKLVSNPRDCFLVDQLLFLEKQK